jgi:Prokaryotic E2 family D
LAVQHDIDKPPARYTIPLPGFVFLCTPNRPPWVYAVKSKPKHMQDPVFKAPLLNVYNTGRSCPGTQKYPEAAEEIINAFWVSFFSHEVDTDDRSVRFHTDVERLWQSLNGKHKYPLDDLIEHALVHDLMEMALQI